MKKLSKDEMKMLVGGLYDDGGDGGDGGIDIDDGDDLKCRHAGSVCSKNRQCCSKSCGSSVGATTKYCDGA